MRPFSSGDLRRCFIVLQNVSCACLLKADDNAGMSPLAAKYKRKTCDVLDRYSNSERLGSCRAAMCLQQVLASIPGATSEG